MIFVTVGTHEDQFNRLIKEIDRLQESGCLNEEVFIQSGYSDYLPVKAKYSPIISYQDMDNIMKAARIVITHGGPGSIMHSLHYNKIPIVVPRQKVYGEHVDDHQVLFTKRLEKAGRVITVLDIKDLERIIADYDKISKVMGSESNCENNLERFICELDKITNDLLSQ